MSGVQVRIRAGTADMKVSLAGRCPRCGEGKLFAGFIVCGLALWVEVNYEPPYWVHIVLWTPLILGLTLGLLRPLKALMVFQQYRMRAEEGRLDES